MSAAYSLWLQFHDTEAVQNRQHYRTRCYGREEDLEHDEQDPPSWFKISIAVASSSA
jgi:hypothetical protein